MSIYVYPSGTETEIQNMYLGYNYTPSSDTLLYIPLNSIDTYKNMAGNDYATTQGGTITYQTDNSTIEVGEFDGNDLVSYGTSISLGGNSFTIAFWTRLTAQTGTIVGLQKSGYSYSYRMYLSNGYLYFFNSSNPLAFTLSKWRFVRFTKSGTSVSYGVKGIGSTSTSRTESSQSSLGDFTFGAGITGAMSNIIVEKGAWSTTKLNAYFNGTKGQYTL